MQSISILKSSIFKAIIKSKVPPLVKLMLNLTIQQKSCLLLLKSNKVLLFINFSKQTFATGQLPLSSILVSLQFISPRLALFPKVYCYKIVQLQLDKFEQCKFNLNDLQGYSNLCPLGIFSTIIFNVSFKTI